MPERSAVLPAFRPYLTRVSRTERLSSHVMRLILTGPELMHFGTDGYDQRIKIMLPLDDGTWSDPLLFDPSSVRRGAWYEQWKSIDPRRRNPIRTYTIRSVDTVRRELTIDFALHQHPGPAGSFACRATQGDELVVIGPDARSVHSGIGIDFHPGPARQLLLVGDETAVPAIGAILDSLRRDRWSGFAKVIVEMPADDDIPRWAAQTTEQTSTAAADASFTAEISCQSRGTGRHGGTLPARVTDAVERMSSQVDRLHAPAYETSGAQPLQDVDVDHELLWEVPASADAPLYAWVAGEAASVRDIRRLLVRGHHLRRDAVAFMGYWRLGKPEI